jgi:hypothetical protein
LQALEEEINLLFFWTPILITKDLLVGDGDGDGAVLVDTVGSSSSKIVRHFAENVGRG